MISRASESLQKNKDLYQWKLDDGYPPHVATVPEADNKISAQIFDVKALLQTGGMLVKNGEISAQYFRLAPDPKAPTTFKALIKHNQDQRGAPGVNANMLFKSNIGMSSLFLFF
jgi:hypothetical protein